VPNGDYASFSRAIFGSRECPPRICGELVTTTDASSAEHAGVHHFTVGQRRGLRVVRSRAALRHEPAL